MLQTYLKPLSTNFTKWSSTVCLSIFGHFVGLALKRLNVNTDLYKFTLLGIPNLLVFSWPIVSKGVSLRRWTDGLIMPSPSLSSLKYKNKN